MSRKSHPRMQSAQKIMSDMTSIAASKRRMAGVAKKVRRKLLEKHKGGGEQWQGETPIAAVG